ncbi:PIG-L family deacetylase [Flavisolibacter nicotianae]|uniref:PIG-L family deacetylase n=1 Tax=Flavisolibacter nicotianae TaxID=2364882 RepID=UPI000EB0BF21|nr:PIG-L family deacetylase [Flavisolibacter nicotianae]
MKKLLLCCSALLAITSFAQTPAFPTSGDIYLGIKKLNVLGSVLYLAAHPDDENTRLLTYFSKEKLYRTGYLSLTRGDGGQNLIGEEQGVELGLIRTQELLAARRIDGAEQFFSRAFDFGYSKSPEETFTKWDREKILSDVVWVIRKFQPDVIITRFPTTGEGGHGQHTASAILAVEAFRAAADPKRFPEQLKWVQPWQARRLLWNTFNFGSANTTGPGQFTLDAGDYNPVLGKSYGEIAAESRSQHKSQGFGVPRGRGEAIEYFKTIGGDEPHTDLHEGINTTWSKALNGASLQTVQKQVTDLLAGFDFSAPQKSVPQLAALYQALSAEAAGNVWVAQKAKEVKDLLVAASGLWLEAVTSQSAVVKGDSLQFSVIANDRLGYGMQLKRIQMEGFDTSLSAALQKNKNVSITKKVRVSPKKELTQPYWLRETMHEGYFEVKDQNLIGQPDVEKAFPVTVTLSLNGQDISVTRPLQYKYSDQVKGEVYQPFFVLPPATVSLNPPVLLLNKNTNQPKDLTVFLIAQKQLNGTAEAHVRSRSIDSTKPPEPLVLAPRTAHPYLFSLSSKSLQNRKDDNLFGSVSIHEKQDTATAYLSMRTISYDHIPSILYFFGSTIKLVNLDLKTEGKKIGYIVGAGDKVPEALEQMGYEVTLLTAKELERNNLQQYDAIISGVRAFNANDWMGRFYDKLMAYVEGGGNYIVQYSQNNNIRGKIGPYNFTVSNRRITDENAAVTFLSPQHPALNFPNKITQDDFKGWIQERSIYHADGWDPHFEPILSMNDPGEQAHNGSLIVTRYGKGFFTYTGLVFFRELPAGVPGAYRLLANLIALNKLKGM